MPELDFDVKGSFRSYMIKVTDPGSLGDCVAEVSLTFLPLIRNAYIEVLCEQETFFFTINI